MSHIIYRVIEYGLQRQTFILRDMYTDLNVTPDEQEYIKHIIATGRFDNPNHIVLPLRRDNGRVEDYHCSILPSAIVAYNDYLEIQEARKSAQTAKILSLAAILISIAIGAAQIILQK